MPNKMLVHSFVATKILIKEDNDIRELRENISFLEIECE